MQLHMQPRCVVCSKTSPNLRTSDGMAVITLNTINMITSIPDEKLVEINTVVPKRKLLTYTSVMEFCDHYELQFIHPSSSTLCYYITHLTCQFQSSKNVHNYISGVRFLHRQLGLTPEAIDSVSVISLLHAASITTKTPPLRCLPTLPHLLHRLCLLTSTLGPLRALHTGVSSFWVLCYAAAN